jgi:hypothetical protein
MVQALLMNDDRIPKMLLNMIIKGKSTKRRLRSRWEGDRKCHKEERQKKERITSEKKATDGEVSLLAHQHMWKH